MKKHSFKEVVSHGLMKLSVWHTPGRVQVAVSSITQNRFDQMKLAFFAAHDFRDHVTHHDFLGTLVDMSKLEALVTKADLAHLLKSPQPTPAAPKPAATSLDDITPKIQPRRHSAAELRPQQIHNLFRLMTEGHSQAYAAAASGMGESAASLLRRGKLNTKLRPALQTAMAQTFNDATTLQGKRTKGVCYANDERNASLIPQLYQLTHIKGMSVRSAAKLMAISASLAQKLTVQAYCNAGPKSRHAWQSNFGDKPSQPKAGRAEPQNIPI